MRLKNDIKLLALVIFILCSCKGSPKDETTYASPYEYEDDEQEMYISEDTESGGKGMAESYLERESELIGYNYRNIINIDNIDTNDSSLDLYFDEDNPERTESFYERLLENFCCRFYEESFPGRVYVEGTLKVDNVSKKDSHTVKVQGIHTFKGRKLLFGLVDARIPYKDKKFEAFVRSDGNNKYHVNFSRSQQLLIHDQINSQDIPFTYNPCE